MLQHHRKKIEDITFEDWDNMLKVNLQGPFHLIQKIIPSMINNNYGKIINITSIGAVRGFNQVHYALSWSYKFNQISSQYIF